MKENLITEQEFKTVKVLMERLGCGYLPENWQLFSDLTLKSFKDFFRLLPLVSARLAVAAVNECDERQREDINKFLDELSFVSSLLIEIRENEAIIQSAAALLCEVYEASQRFSGGGATSTLLRLWILAVPASWVGDTCWVSLLWKDWRCGFPCRHHLMPPDRNGEDGFTSIIPNGTSPFLLAKNFSSLQR